MPNGHPAEDRLIAAESALAHLQRDFDQLHSVVLAQQAEIEKLRHELELLTGRVSRFEEDDLPDAREERPPHY
jgi:uncharacterized coiled-coil protein SlyX